MPISDVLKNLRSSGYTKTQDDKTSKDVPESPRIIRLMDDEVKALEPTQKGPGEEIVCEVSGKLEKDGHFHVMSVRAPGGGGMDDEKGMAAEVAGQAPPMMQQQTMPSPS